MNLSPSYSSTVQVMFLDMFNAPKGLSNSTDVVDKVCKFVLLVFTCNKEVTEDFKATVNVFSTFGCVGTASPMLNPNGAFWRNNSGTKITSKVFLVFAQTLDLAKGLDYLKLVPLETVSALLGRVSVFAEILVIAPPLAVTKDILIIFSTVFSIKANWDESKAIAVKHYGGALGPARYENDVHTNRIAVIADVFKLAVVGVMLGVTLSGASLATPIMTSTYCVVKLGTISTGLGYASAGAAVVKALHSVS